MKGDFRRLSTESKFINTRSSIGVMLTKGCYKFVYCSQYDLRRYLKFSDFMIFSSSHFFNFSFFYFSFYIRDPRGVKRGAPMRPPPSGKRKKSFLVIVQETVANKPLV